MDLKKLVEALDAKVLSGDIMGAFDQFFADEVVTFSTQEDMTRSKAQKMEALRWFFEGVSRINRIERPAFRLASDNVTESQFLFDFSDRWNNPMVYGEVIRRTWENGKVVEEQYLLNQSLEAGLPSAAAAKKEEAKKSPVKSATTAGKKTEEAIKPAKSAEPVKKAVAEKAPKAASNKTLAKPETNKADDLTLVEGIGPKIADLLKNGGIDTFEVLAATKPAAIKAILEAAGSRYQMHDPATWPKQAALARDGKTAELQKLQAELKGGKKA